MNKLTITHSLAALTLGASLLAACSKQEQTPPPADSAKIAATPVKQGDGRGVIKGIDTAMKTMTLSHNDIPGIMEAMAMEYKVDRPELFAAARTGDSVVFTLQDRGEGNFVVTAIAPIKK